MSEQKTVEIDEQAVASIIASGDIHTFFQPVISIPTKSIVGFEAFSRGGNSNTCTIAPSMLFHDDLSPKLKIGVDRMCREKALAQFKPIHERHDNLLGFININADILAHVEDRSEVLKHQAASLDIRLDNLVLECPASKAASGNVLEYADIYRDFGFKLCIDNCHMDDPFSQLISILKPDFIKVGRPFYAEGERKDYSAKALEALLSVADKVGAAVIAQGVETEEESIRLLTSGVHLQQGYYYTKDENARTNDPARMFFQKIIDTYDKYKRVKREVVRRKKERFTTAFKSVGSLCAKFANMPETNFENACKTLVHNSDSVISMFVLNGEGEQLTARSHVKPTRGRTGSVSILGTDKGVDHSVQDYVMYLDMGYEKFITQPFCSPYTGEEACLISKSFFNREGARYVLCIEMPYPG